MIVVVEEKAEPNVAIPSNPTVITTSEHLIKVNPSGIVRGVGIITRN